MTTNKFLAQIDGRDQVEIELESSQDKTLKSVRALGCKGHLNKVKLFRSQIGTPLLKIVSPTGNHHTDMLIREAVSKAKGEFSLPYKEEELCHCRAVPTKVVDQAILSGCNTTEQVSRATSASTACGSCRADVQKLLNYRKGP
jgi:bacterioferritin-associated ferredoxin